MLKLMKFFILGGILVLVAQLSQAQETLKILPYAGINQTLTDFKDFAQPGMGVGLATDYQLTKNFALGIDLNYQSNSFSNPLDYSKIPDYLRLECYQKDKWGVFTMGVGPTYTFGSDRLSVDIFSKAGISLVDTPISGTVLKYNMAKELEAELFQFDKQKLTSFGITSGLRINYQLSNVISLFLNPQYVYSSAKVRYGFQDIDAAIIDEHFNLDYLIEQPLISKEINPSYFNINAGVTLNINTSSDPDPSKGKNSIGETVEQIRNSCYGAELVAPKNQSDLYLTQSDRPVFKWKETSDGKPAYYVFKLLDEAGETLYSHKTKKTEVGHSKKLEAVYQEYFNKDRKKIFWEVTSAFEDCGELTSNQNTITGTKRSVGLIADFRDINCETPAFDSFGNVHYQAEVYLENPISNTTTIIIPSQIFTVTTTSNTTATNVTYVGSPTFPISLAPGASTTVQFKFNRPIGETHTALHVSYHESGYPDLLVEETPVEELPNCICNVCDSWKIEPSHETMYKHNSPTSNMRVRSDFKIVNADPIQQVKAEIISVQHKISDTLCYTCTTEANTMGLFNKRSGSGLVISTVGWEDNGKATLYDQNNDTYGNEFTWRAQSTQGIDFSTNKIFLMNINLPPMSSLDCCETSYIVCIRYTFTDINCQTCDYVICYEYNSTDSQGGGGPIIADPHTNSTFETK